MPDIEELNVIEFVIEQFVVYHMVSLFELSAVIGPKLGIHVLAVIDELIVEILEHI